jgi:hypothetical protein
MVTGDKSDDTMPIQIAERLSGTNRHDHQLGKLRSYSQTAHQIDDEIVVSPDRND